MINKKLIFSLILGIFIFSLASVSAGNLGTFKLNEEMQITNYCNEGSCTYMNLSSIKLPNGTKVNYNEAMTKNVQDFSYTYNPTILGEYIFDTCGNPGGDIICDSDEFTVTKTGVEFTPQEANTYLIMLLALIVLLAGAAYGAVKIPYSNRRNDDGQIIGINDLKYLKVFCIFISYGIITWMANLMITISNNYIDLGVALGFFTVMFKAMIFMLYPILIFTVIFMVIEAVKDSNIGKLLDRGFTV